jgi:hypothetical protein
MAILRSIGDFRHPARTGAGNRGVRNRASLTIRRSACARRRRRGNERRTPARASVPRALRRSGLKSARSNVQCPSEYEARFIEPAGKLAQPRAQEAAARRPVRHAMRVAHLAVTPRERETGCGGIDGGLGSDTGCSGERHPFPCIALLGAERCPTTRVMQRAAPATAGAPAQRGGLVSAWAPRHRTLRRSAEGRWPRQCRSRLHCRAPRRIRPCLALPARERPAGKGASTRSAPEAPRRAAPASAGEPAATFFSDGVDRESRRPPPNEPGASGSRAHHFQWLPEGRGRLGDDPGHVR